MQNINSNYASTAKEPYDASLENTHQTGKECLSNIKKEAQALKGDLNSKFPI